MRSGSVRAASDLEQEPKRAVLAAGVAAVPAVSATARAQYPLRPVHIVLGFPPGGSSDVIGRLMADVMVPPDLREAHWDGLHRYLETREARILNRRLELRALRADPAAA